MTTLAEIKTAILSSVALAVPTSLVSWDAEPRAFDKASGIRVLLSVLASVEMSLTDQSKTKWNPTTNKLDRELICHRRMTIRARAEAVRVSVGLGAYDALEDIRTALRSDETSRAELGSDCAFLGSTSTQDLTIAIDGRDVSKASVDLDFYVRFVKSQSSLDWIETVDVTQKRDFGSDFGVAYG